MLNFKFNIIHFYIRFPLFNILLLLLLLLSQIPLLKFLLFFTFSSFTTKFHFETEFFFKAFWHRQWLRERKTERMKGVKNCCRFISNNFLESQSKEKVFRSSSSSLLFSSRLYLYFNLIYPFQIEWNKFFLFWMKKQNVFSPSFCGRKNEAFKILSSFAYSQSSVLSKQTLSDY